MSEHRQTVDAVRYGRPWHIKCAARLSYHLLAKAVADK